ncbi:hypothetical protein [Polynucleobacter sp. MWH-Aus1W21]|uniref:hypothetical protein n=1 Tax=Polynucleobacter sp. MWH-Aus1W21 TaxID=1855880 RepID=UPI001BFDC890|nr:hypothetical protein [Polynucleobacter sp. MWH-Aus1W21]QWD67150.1 hypothetical protein ICW03_04945 [Polynucleobacter sp. MWH-Aus1W21]
MINFLKQIGLPLLLLVSSSAAVADQEPASKQAISAPNAYIASDSEGFSTYKYSAGFMPLYEHGEKYTGISYQHNYFTQGGWDSSAEVYTLLTRAINPRTGLGYNLNIGYNLENGHKVLTTDSNYGFRLTDSTKAEVMLNRDRVETQNSLTNGIYYTLGAASVEQQLLERLTAIAMLGQMNFSDTNTRPIVRGKLIYNLVPDYGLTAQLRYRQFRDTNTNVPNNYFNPDQYSEAMFAFGMRKRLAGWMLSGTAGVGRQRVNQDPSTTTQLYEFAATSPVASNDYYFKTRVGYGKSAGFLGPNYFYRYIMEELIFPF